MSQFRAHVDLQLVIDGSTVASETLATRVGADVVVVETAVESEALSLTSTYLSNVGEATMAAHALAWTSDRSRSWSQSLADLDASGMPSDRALRFDHLLVLHECLEMYGRAATIKTDDAVERIRRS